MAQERIKTIKSETYKGHTIRVVENSFGVQTVLIDNDTDTINDNPHNLFAFDDRDFEYASVADAKRMINGQRPNAAPCYIDNPEIRKRYFSRFSK